MKNILMALTLTFTSQIFALGNSKQALFVVMAGYSTCSSKERIPAPYNTGVYQGFDKFSKSLASHFSDLEISYIATCFFTSPPPEGEMALVTSKEPNLQRSGNASTLRNEIETLATSESSIYLIGHSYGGWLAMYLSTALKLSHPLAAVVTLDPISPACGPTQFLFGSQVCKQAPKDLNNAAIRSTTKDWLNVYQTQDDGIHSSSISEARNLKLEYRDPHTQLDDDPRTWDAITSVVVSR